MYYDADLFLKAIKTSAIWIGISRSDIPRSQLPDGTDPVRVSDPHRFIADPDLGF